jgi:GAF domain-containing protein
MRRIAEQIAAATETEELAAVVCRSLLALLGADLAALAFVIDGEPVWMGAIGVLHDSVVAGEPCGGGGIVDEALRLGRQVGLRADEPNQAIPFQRSPILHREGIRRAWALPSAHAGVERAVMVIGMRDERRPANSNFALVGPIIEQASVALHRAWLLRDERRLAERLAAILRAVAEAHGDLASMLRLLADETVRLFDADAAVIATSDDAAGVFAVAAASGVSPEFAAGARWPREPIASALRAEGQIVADDLREPRYQGWLSWWEMGEDFRSVLTHALCHGDRVIGLFTIATRGRVHRFTNGDRSLARLLARFVESLVDLTDEHPAAPAPSEPAG